MLNPFHWLRRTATLQQTGQPCWDQAWITPRYRRCSTVSCSLRLSSTLLARSTGLLPFVVSSLDLFLHASQVDQAGLWTSKRLAAAHLGEASMAATPGSESAGSPKIGAVLQDSLPGALAGPGAVKQALGSLQRSLSSPAAFMRCLNSALTSSTEALEESGRSSTTPPAGRELDDAGREATAAVAASSAEDSSSSQKLLQQVRSFMTCSFVRNYEVWFRLHPVPAVPVSNTIAKHA